MNCLKVGLFGNIQFSFYWCHVVALGLMRQGNHCDHYKENYFFLIEMVHSFDGSHRILVGL